MHLDFKEILTAFMILFAVIDIIGNVPIVLSLRAKAGKIQSAKATVVACILMVVFLYIGEELISLLGVDVNSFAVAGALVLFFIALEMILGIQIYKEDEQVNTASIVPLAFPLLAGPGSLTTILSLRAEFHAENILVAIILNLILVYIVLKSSNVIERVLGNGGIGVLKKVFGIILLAVSVKLFAANLIILINSYS